MRAGLMPVAAVTGASRGLGRAIAEALAAQGYAVACLGRDVDALNETAQRVRAAGAAVSLHTADVGDPSFAAPFVTETVAEHGGLDLVVNCAGILGEKTAAEMTPEEYLRVLNVNLVAAFALSSAAYPHLRDAPGASVVNIGSFYGSIGVPGFAAYASSKAGMEGLTRTLAVEWARDDIRVVCVAPGYVATEMLQGALSDERVAERLVSRIPLKRVASAEEIAGIVCFLASPAAAFITGATIVADGGQVIKI
ncbi:MAG TPA: SDR family oxidoreductase [Acidimicrobiales bacterium]|jgi:NAD(P)-dependent dehydrogenase (short-subunit alcohol dehydrogenase family)|nr:SDR family oxidoreductase [Acidimicrobiales bacterium]